MYGGLQGGEFSPSAFGGKDADMRIVSTRRRLVMTLLRITQALLRNPIG
jgi:hypothetical protein